jgi:hypothetical protein
MRTPWPGRISQIYGYKPLDAGRATRVAQKRPTSHTLLSTCLFIACAKGLRKGVFTELRLGETRADSITKDRHS